MSTSPPPHLCIAGTAKAGTTSLYAALSMHPDITPSRIKEPRTFIYKSASDDLWENRRYTRTEVLKDVSKYDGIFPELTSGKVAMEASPVYLYSSRAARAIHAKNPECKFVFILRDPVERAFSHYCHLTGLGIESCSFVEALKLEEQRIEENYDFSFHYVKMGMYFSQLERFIKTFPREQLLVLDYDQYMKHPISTLESIYRFVGISSTKNISIPRLNVSRKSKRRIHFPHSVAKGLKGILPNQFFNRLRSFNHTRESADKKARKYITERVSDDMRLLREVCIHSESFEWLDLYS